MPLLSKEISPELTITAEMSLPCPAPPSQAGMGLGLHFDPHGLHPPLVTWLDPDLPAGVCGSIEVGDSLLAAAGHSTQGRSSIHDLLDGAPGTTVRLRLRRPGAEYEVELERGAGAHHSHTEAQVSLHSHSLLGKALWAGKGMRRTFGPMCETR